MSVQWKQEIAVLGDLRTNWSDVLNLVDGHLELQKGKWGREMGRPVVVNPPALANHLDALIHQTAKNHFDSIKSSGSYDQVVDFGRELKCLTSRLSDLQYLFRSHDLAEPQAAHRFHQLYNSASAYLKEVIAFKKTLTKPPLNERSVQHTDYDERTRLDSIKWRYPKRVPLSETVAAAKKALSFSQPPSSGLSYLLSVVFGTGSQNLHMKAYQLYTIQILNCPLITEEVAAAFQQLAANAELLDLKAAKLASSDPVDFATYINEEPNGISPLTYLEAVKKVCTASVTLESLSDFYPMLNKAYSRESNKYPTFEAYLINQADIKKYFENDLCTYDPHLTPKVLQHLLDSASSSPTCRKIALSKNIAELPFVSNYLNTHSYRLIKDEKYNVEYERV